MGSRERSRKDTSGTSCCNTNPVTSEDEFRAADMMAKKYPEIVKHITLPENFSTEIETGLSQITSADDPQMKAIIVISGQAGLLPALQGGGEQT